VLHNDRSVELMNREAADEIERLRAERDEARQQVRDIIQRKEAQMLTIIEEGNGVARVLYCSKEDGK
jgi:hypothetical protein